LSVVAALIGQTILPAATTVSAAGTQPAARNLNNRPVPNFDINLTKYSLRLPSPARVQALDALKLSLNDSSVTARGDKRTGPLDTLMDFASASSTLDPEAAAIQPNTSYVYRVVGWLGVAEDFQIVSTQTLRVPQTGTATTASTSSSTALTPCVLFSVNSLTGAVTAQLVQ
jgi:hypothetical protein